MAHTDPERQFLALLDDHRRALLKVCWAYGRSAHDRDDLFQEIVARLWAAFGRYDPSRPFATWMYRVALNVAIDVRRRRRRWGRDGASIEQGEDEDGVGVRDVVDAGGAASRPAEEAARSEQVDALRELLDRQTDADRAILLLYLEGHSHRQIGDVLGISESNVGTRLHRLKASLRQAVDEGANQ